METITLYKYRAINDWSLDTLRSTRMWFSLPAKLNDTFEFSLPVFISMSPSELVEHYEKRFTLDYAAPELLAAMMTHGGSDSFSVTDQFVQSFLSSTEENRSLFVIAAIHFLREQGLTTQDIVSKLTLDLNSELASCLERELREAYYRNQDIGLLCGVLSLSGRNDNALMWAHYADSCKGMCIGVTFVVDDLVNSDFIPLWVDYADELPVLDASQFFDHGQQNVMDMLKLFYCTKHTAWSHEAELRLIARRGDVLLELPGTITEVILGEKTDQPAAQQVLDAIHDRSAITFSKMMREPGTWKYRAYGQRI